MTEDLMEEQVRQLIERVYCRKYVGLLETKELINYKGDHYGWLLKLGLHCDLRPLQIAFDGTDEEFLKHLEKRLRQDHLHDVDYYNGFKVRLDPNQDPSTAIPPKDIKASML